MTLILTLRARHEERQARTRNWQEYVRLVRLRGEVVE